MALNELSALQAAKRVAQRHISSEELVRSCLDRIAAREPVVRAWASLAADLAIAEARNKDRQPVQGALHGVPVGIKDVIDTADMPTQMGSPIYQGYRPLADAACVSALRAAGAIVIGKTITAEFAFVAPGPTTNPHDVLRTPGGSSSGSAAAVADFMVPAALGTQTGGSVVRPASFCGVFGFKPTFGVVNRSGLKFAAENLDTIGILARDLDDVALFKNVLTGGQLDTLRVPGTFKPKFALCRTGFWAKASKDCQNAVEAAAEALARNGAEVTELSLPGIFDALTEARQTINNFERARAGAWEWQHHRDKLSPALTACISDGMAIPYSVYCEALELMERRRVELDGVFDGFDAFITPSASGEAPAGLESTGDSTFQAPWTLLHVPAVTLPTNKGRNGLPIGVQLVSRRFRDDHLLRLAAWSWERCKTD